MNDRADDRASGFEARHAAIIARTLRWANDAAARREFAEAVRWVETVRALARELPDEYKARYASWLRAIEPDHRIRRI
jgi:ribosomal protein L17